MSNRNKYQVYNEASLSQKLAYKMPEYQQYAGSDPEISEQLAIFNVLIDMKVIKETKEIKILRALLNERRKAAFATSERVNEITKMGMQQPKAEKEFFGSDSDQEEENPQ